MPDSIPDSLPQVENGERSVVFNNICATIKLQHLPQIAIHIRNNWELTRAGTLASIYNCRILPQPLFGSHHILFQLEFSDGFRWLLKVPANGYPNAFDKMSALSLRSEVSTMRLLKRETTVPVPEVYHFEDSCSNKLGCPFILMEYISGRPLSEVWFNQQISQDVLERHRIQTLRDVAQAIVQLNKYVFTSGGMIQFDQDGKPSGIGPFRKLHIEAMLNALHANVEFDGANIYCTAGPFNNPKSYFTSMLEERNPSANEDEYSRGLYKLLRLFIDLAFIEDNDIGHKKKFVLSHPDLDIQNIIVSEDGKLRGLIDWDGVVTVPRCLGNERYPSWLTRDWDSMNYRSLLLENLAIAANDPVSFHSIVERVFEEVKAKTARDEAQNEGDSDDGDSTFYAYEVATAYAAGELLEPHRWRLIRGFQALLQ